MTLVIHWVRVQALGAIRYAGASVEVERAITSGAGVKGVVAGGAGGLAKHTCASIVEVGLDAGIGAFVSEGVEDVGGVGTGDTLNRGVAARSALGLALGADPIVFVVEDGDGGAGEIAEPVVEVVAIHASSAVGGIGAGLT